jgi:hypothetical protein
VAYGSHHWAEMAAMASLTAHYQGEIAHKLVAETALGE